MARILLAALFAVMWHLARPFPFVSKEIMKDFLNLKSELKTMEAKLADAEKDMNDDTWKTYNGHCYSFGLDQLIWPDAEKICRQMGGYLVKIDNAAENNFLRDIILSRGPHWIGLTDLVEGEYRWMYDQSVASYKNFAAGQPNKDGNCVFIHLNATWSDDRCNANYKYICENNNCF